jgi:hypothetical protein
MCGRAGRMAVHTPEVCYRGAGFDLFESPVTKVIRDASGGEAGVFLSARFSKQSTGLHELRLYWAWGDGTDWQAPSNPRWAFRGRPYLYKLYVSHELEGPPSADVTAGFLRELLPALKETLSAP